MSRCQKDKMGVGLDLGGSASDSVSIEADSVAPCEFLAFDFEMLGTSLVLIIS